MIKAVIIDDIALARASLKADIEDYCPEIDILGEAEGVISGLKLIKKLKPELVFLDIHMADGEGFDILEILQDRKASIIFTTASDKHAIEAFQHNALDYLLKPIDPDLLVRAVEKHKLISTVDTALKETNKTEKSFRLSLSTQDDLRMVSVDDIVRLVADGNYTTVYEIDGTKTMVSKSMKEFEKILNPHGFYRSHQSHLVSIKKVKSYLKSEGGFLLMVDGSEVPVSVRKKPEVVGILKERSIG